jgi:PhnB protein
MKSVSPYLNFNGNTEEAFKFYQSVFGGELLGLTRFKETPDGAKLSAAEQNKIMHVSLPLSKDVVLMATDALESMGHKLVEGNNYSICIDAESKAEVDRIFSKLSQGGKVDMPAQDTFWGAYFAMCKDKFGIQWMLNYTYPKK